MKDYSKMRAQKLVIVQKQQGVALLVVMLIMALMTTVAATMSGRMFTNFNRAESQIRYQQAYWYAISVEELSKFALLNSFKNDAAVTLSQPWAIRGQVFPIDEWQAKGNIYDKQACFNLNGLRSAEPQEDGANPSIVNALQRLIESQGIDGVAAEIAATSTWEYVDSDNAVQSTNGVEDSEYEGRKTPHVTTNGFLADVTEWRAINGVTSEMYEKVAPFLCAIPSEEVKVNVNTLEEKDAPLLAALLDTLVSQEQAAELIKDRDPIEGWQEINDFIGESALSAATEDQRENLQQLIDVKSRFFESDTEITLNQTRFRVRSLLERSDDEQVNVLRRRFGGTSERNTDDTPKQ